MSDHGEITSLISRLGGAFDRQDFAALADCWAEDAVLVFTNAGGLTREMAGRDTIMSWVGKSWKCGPIAIRHFVSALDIDLSADYASVRYYTLYPLIGSMPSTPGFGEYHAQVRRDRDGKWRVVNQMHRQHSMGAGDYAR